MFNKIEILQSRSLHVTDSKAAGPPCPAFWQLPKCQLFPTAKAAEHVVFSFFFFAKIVFFIIIWTDYRTLRLSCKSRRTCCWACGFLRTYYRFGFELAVKKDTFLENKKGLKLVWSFLNFQCNGWCDQNKSVNVRIP